MFLEPHPQFFGTVLVLSLGLWWPLDSLMTFGLSEVCHTFQALIPVCFIPLPHDCVIDLCSDRKFVFAAPQLLKILTVIAADTAVVLYWLQQTKDLHDRNIRLDSCLLSLYCVVTGVCRWYFQKKEHQTGTITVRKPGLVHLLHLKSTVLHPFNSSVKQLGILAT